MTTNTAIEAGTSAPVGTGVSTLTPSHLVLHCSATVDGRSYSWDAIRRYHVDTLGWSDIGYHAGVEMVGRRLVMVRGRPWTQQGAHCAAAGRNRDSLGLCVVGRYDIYPPSPELHRAVCRALAWICVVAGIAPEMISGHREWDARKTCPGTAWDLDATRVEVGKLVRHSDVPALAINL